MTTLVFLAALAAIFVAVLAVESDGESTMNLRRPAGILTWLTRGNWPAKVGGALVIVGVGALLRYALLHVDVPPQVKLTAGVVIALALGFASMVVPEGNAKRSVSLALGGAAFGVAYLTAYSAFGLFQYLSNPAGLGLLGVTAVAAGVYAVTRSALSLAMLSMVGAFLAPAFAVTDPGPQVVYGYYVGASLLTLVMVALRGWRPLIHLSFLFTLVGGVFFAWTAQYYTGPHAGTMMTMLLILSAVHVAMPIAERRGSQAAWVARLDVAYMVALPVVAALLTYFLASNRTELSTGLLALGAIWAIAAAGLLAAKREGVAAHAVIAALLAALGIAIRFRDLPWEIILLALSVAALLIAAWQRKPADRLHSVTAGFVVLFGAIHILSSTASPTIGAAFLNGTFVERIIGAILLIVAGACCRRIRQALDTLLLAMGIVWALVSIGIELIRWDLATIALVVHWVLLLLAASLWIPGRRVRIADGNVALLTIAILGTAAWSSAGAPSAAVAWWSLVVASLALIGLAVRPFMSDRDSREQRVVAALAAPAAAAIWAFQIGTQAGDETVQFQFSIAAAVAIATLFAGHWAKDERGDWLDAALPVFGVAFAGALVVATLVSIVRSPWAIVLEILCLAGLIVVTTMRGARQRPTDLSTGACMVGAALIIQAHLMRWLGPPGPLDAGDILQLRWPAVLSLVWVIVGSALTLWSRKVASRSLWIAGATLLVGSAVKLLLHDFGSLGQLTNILAVIAAGGVFLLVGWLAPMPPAAPKPAITATTPAPVRTATARNAPADEAAQGKNAWTIAMVLIVAGAIFYLRAPTQEFVRDILMGSTSVSQDVTQAPALVREKKPRKRSSVAAEIVAAESAAIDPGVEASPVAAAAPVVESRYEEPSRPRPTAESYVRPPTVDASGVPTYTQYSYPQSSEDDELYADDGYVPPKPVPGDAGIDQLLRDGSLRKAMPSDVDLWIAATGSTDRSALHLDIVDYRSGGRYVYGTYVVQRTMTYPDGLTGAHSVTFIVPRGVPVPYGDPGHSRVLETP